MENTIKGVDGTATLEADGITLEFKGFTADKTKKQASPVHVPYAAIDSVDLKIPGIFKSGHIRLVTDGVAELPPAKDPRTLLISTDDWRNFVADLRASIKAGRYTHETRTGIKPTPAKEPTKWQKFSTTMDDRTPAATLGKYKVMLNGRLDGPGVNGRTASSAIFEHGAQSGSRVTATRVVAGAVAAGPVGAVVGGLAKKRGKDKVYVTVTFEDGATMIIDAPAKEERAARKFTATLNNTAHH